MTFSLRRTTLSLALCSMTFGLAHAGVLDESMGRWVAKIDVDGHTMTSGLELFMRADGTPAGELIAIDRGFAAARLGKVAEKDGMLDIDGPRGAHLNLKLEQGALVGELQQGPKRLSVRFNKVDGFGAPLRAQTPRAPFGYQSSELVFTSADGTKLAATLTRPSGTQAVNAVVLIHGTGPEDRDQTEDGHQNFAVLADHLARSGVAVLRFDKRGVKRSGGSYEAHTQADLLADALAAVAVLRARADILKVGVIGHSEGGEIAARAAGKGKQPIDFLVSLAGPGRELMPVLEYENVKGMQLAGATPAETAIAARVGRQFFGVVKDNADVGARMAALKTLMQGLQKEERDVLAKYRPQLPTLAPSLAASPWAYSAMNSHPYADWRAVHVPALVLNGEKDAQMSAADELPAIAAALKEGGNRAAQIETLPGLNHNFQNAGTGAQDEYSQIEETIAPQVLKKIAAFIATQR
jgi:pimeloyl-ACP methyl ester carboxylesterase